MEEDIPASSSTCVHTQRHVLLRTRAPAHTTHASAHKQLGLTGVCYYLYLPLILYIVDGFGVIFGRKWKSQVQNSAEDLPHCVGGREKIQGSGSESTLLFKDPGLVLSTHVQYLTVSPVPAGPHDTDPGRVYVTCVIHMCMATQRHK